MTTLQISSDIKYHPHSSPMLLVYAIKYEAFLCSLQYAWRLWEVPDLFPAFADNKPLNHTA
jgi:hypothetical protein